MKRRTALILANGTFPSGEKIKRIARGCSAVICADGAYAAALRRGIRPHILVGDMDSLESGSRLLPGLKIIYEPDPSRCDLEKSLDAALAGGFDIIHIAGGTGGRWDHTLALFQLAEKFSRRALITIHDWPWEMTIVSGKIKFPYPKGRKFSVFPLSSARVSIKNALYPLHRELLVKGSRGLSNEGAGGVAALEVHSGSVWLVRTAK